jgi:RNA polymerase sigma factor (sigma-70 family)
MTEEKIKTGHEDDLIEDVAPGIETRMTINEAIGELGPRHKAIILMRFFDDMTFAAIGQALGISGSASRVSYLTAMDKLRIKMRKKGLNK